MKKQILGLVFLTSFALANTTPSFEFLTLKSGRQVAVSPVKLSPAVIDMQRMRSQQLQHAVVNRATNKLPSEINLGMNGVPVLNQGLFPACVTFAVTAAYDAAINKGDYVSQLCLLQLSTTVTQNSFWHSLWIGSSINTVLSYISQYGIMTIDDQKLGYCNKVKTYPLTYDEKYMQHKMSTKDYHFYSENAYRIYLIEPQVLFKFAHAYANEGDTNRILTLGNNSDGWINPEDAFTAIRKSLAEGNRIVLEFLFKGELARGGIKAKDNDTWFAGNDLKTAFNTPHYLSDAKDWFSHDVVIYGFNDETITRNAKVIPFDDSIR